MKKYLGRDPKVFARHKRDLRIRWGLLVVVIVATILALTHPIPLGAQTRNAPAAIAQVATSVKPVSEFTQCLRDMDALGHSLKDARKSCDKETTKVVVIVTRAANEIADTTKNPSVVVVGADGWPIVRNVDGVNTGSARVNGSGRSGW